MLQKLPGDEGDDDGWARAGALFDTLSAEELAATPGPALLHVTIDIKANVWPLVPPNHANSSMLDASPATPSAEPAVATDGPEKKNALPA